MSYCIISFCIIKFNSVLYYFVFHYTNIILFFYIQIYASYGGVSTSWNLVENKESLGRFQ